MRALRSGITVCLVGAVLLDPVGWAGEPDAAPPLERAATALAPDPGREMPVQSGVHLDAALLKSGDLIFRRGRSRDSHVVLMLDRDSPFSHVGLIDRVAEGVFVIHLLPGDAKNGQNLTRREPLETFVAPEAAASAAVYRMRPEYRAYAARAMDAARQFLAQRVAFDTSFDSESPERFYCTELVWRAYGAAGLDLIEGRLARLSFPLARGRYVLVSSLLESRYLVEVLQVTE